MAHLRRIVVASLVGLTFLFNIERLDFGTENIIDIGSFVYVLGFLAFLSVIIFPIFWRSPISIPMTFWVGVYLICKLFIFAERPLFGGIYTYISITEATLLSIVTWLAYILARTIRDFEQAVENITLQSANRRVRRLDEALEDIQVEMFRSRHHHHPLSVVVVEPKPEVIKTALHQAVQEAQQTMLRSYVINSMARTLSKYLRRIDLILEQREQGRFVILCPETNAKDLQLLVEYIQAIALKKLGTMVACGVATFPDEALTFEELVNRAESHLRQTNGCDNTAEVMESSMAKPVETLLHQPNGNGHQVL